jgi:hypothetical protein
LVNIGAIGGIAGDKQYTAAEAQACQLRFYKKTVLKVVGEWHFC